MYICNIFFSSHFLPFKKSLINNSWDITGSLIRLGLVLKDTWVNENVFHGKSLPRVTTLGIFISAFSYFSSSFQTNCLDFSFSLPSWQTYLPSRSQPASSFSIPPHLSLGTDIWRHLDYYRKTVKDKDLLGSSFSSMENGQGWTLGKCADPQHQLSPRILPAYLIQLFPMLLQNPVDLNVLHCHGPGVPAVSWMNRVAGTSLTSPPIVCWTHCQGGKLC
jgi:hypothetical protein